MFTNLNQRIDKKISQKKKIKRILVILAILTIAIVIPSIFIFLGLKETTSHGKAIIAAYKEQNFDNLRNEVASTKGGLQKVNVSLSALFWLKIIPFLGAYYSDAKGIAGASVEELTAMDELLADLQPIEGELGFDNHPKSGPERVSQAVKILDKSIPFLDKIEVNLQKGADLVKNIDTGKYPEKYKGKDISKNLEVVKSFIIGASIAVKSGRDALKIAPQALGIPGSKTYLLLFQNDKEIRATGGFMTAYAFLTINNGQVKSSISDDIYRLDEKLLHVCLTKICPLTPPDPIIKYLPEVSGKARSAWSMRDSNISPDLPTSARQFETMYQMLGEGLPFDGIIYIDTKVVEDLIKITGPIDVY